MGERTRETPDRQRSTESKLYRRKVIGPKEKVEKEKMLARNEPKIGQNKSMCRDLGAGWWPKRKEKPGTLFNNYHIV